MGAGHQGAWEPLEMEEGEELGGITRDRAWGHTTCPGLGLAHLADGAGPGLQRFGPIRSQLLHFLPSEEELEGEAKPAEDEPAHEGNPAPAPRARAAPSREPGPAVCVPQALRARPGARLGVPFSGAGAGERLVGSADAQGDEIPAVNVAQGLSAFLGLEEEQGSLQGAPRALEVCGDGGSVALGWAPRWLPSRAAHTHPLCSSWPLGASGGPWPGTGTRCVSLAG